MLQAGADANGFSRWAPKIAGAAASGLSRLADALSTPAITSLPAEMSELMTVLGELARRLQPLGQLAESAGSMFGLRAMAALRPSTPEAVTATATPVEEPPAPARKKAAAPRKAASAKKAAPKKAARKR